MTFYIFSTFSFFDIFSVFPSLPPHRHDDRKANVRKAGLCGQAAGEGAADANRSGSFHASNLACSLSCMDGSRNKH